MKKFFMDLFTETDNETFDTTKFLAFLVFISAIFFQGYNLIILKIPFDIEKFGIGMGLIFGGLASALGFKKEVNDYKPKLGVKNGELF